MQPAIAGVRELLFPRAAVNAYLVEADVLTLVDTGTPGGAAKVVAAVRGAGRDPRDVGRILLTHRHSDHAGSAAELARLTGAEIHASADDAGFLRDGREQPRVRAATPLGRALVPYVKVARPWRLGPMAVEPSLADGAAIGPFRVIATPGHTAGHVSLLWTERGILFTGDAAAHLTRVGPHPAADDPRRAQESFRRLAREDFEAACFGHGRTIAAGAAAAFRAVA